MPAARRFAVIADIHANYPALEAVIADIKSQGVWQIVCLGDIVGYHTFVRETIHFLKKARIPTVYGNHDLMALKRSEMNGSRAEIVEAIELTRAALSNGEREYLAGLPGALQFGPEVVCVHSTLHSPFVRLRARGDYERECREVRQLSPKVRFCLTGHTHVPGVVHISLYGKTSLLRGTRIPVREGGFYFINPGSVGLPRRSDYRASYAIVDRDSGAVSFRRVAYKRRRVLRRNRSRGLRTSPGPSVLGFRMLRIQDQLALRLRRHNGRGPATVLWS